MVAGVAAVRSAQRIKTNSLTLNRTYEVGPDSFIFLPVNTPAERAAALQKRLGVLQLRISRWAAEAAFVKAANSHARIVGNFREKPPSQNAGLVNDERIVHQNQCLSRRSTRCDGRSL